MLLRKFGTYSRKSLLYRAFRELGRVERTLFLMRFISSTEVRQAVGRSRGGRNTKIHTIADAKGRLLTFVLTGGEAHDCPVGAELIGATEPAELMLGDKGYDSTDLRQRLKDGGTKPVVPNRSNRKKRIRFDRRQYCELRKIENALCRLKDFRRVATRYDKLALVFTASVYLAATVAWLA